jgi:DNA-binding beta-propeller fold protein YncE
VQVLTPTLDFHGFVGAGQLRDPRGVCANADVVVVSEANAHRISVFNRSDGALLRRIGSVGSGRGQLDFPRGLCFMSHDRHVAVTDNSNNRISVFSVDGAFIRHVGGGILTEPYGVACSACDELVVADKGNNRVTVFSASSLSRRWDAAASRALLCTAALYLHRTGTTCSASCSSDRARCFLCVLTRDVTVPTVQSTQALVLDPDTR